MLFRENEIADNHAVIGVDRLVRGHGFRAETSTRPNLVDPEQRRIVRPRVSPATSRFRECVEQSLPERSECSIARRRIEVTPDDQMC